MPDSRLGRLRKDGPFELPRGKAFGNPPKTFRLATLQQFSNIVENGCELASVVIGGLLTSTMLTLFLLPVLYEWVEDGDHSKQPLQRLPSGASDKDRDGTGAPREDG